MKSNLKTYETPVANVIQFEKKIVYTTESGGKVGDEDIPGGEGDLEDGEWIS